MRIFDRGYRSRYAFSAVVDEVPGGGPIWHRHTREEELFHVLGGAVDFYAVNAPGGVRVDAGGTITLPAGVPHRFRNARADEPSPVLMLTAPGGNMQYFADLSAPADRPDDPTDPPDVEAFTAVGRRYGLDILGPDDAVGATVHEEILPLGAGRLPVHAPAGAGGAVTVTGAHTDGRCTLAEITLPPGGTLPKLRHAQFGLFVYAFDDGVLLETDDGGGPVPAGGAAILPFSVWYRLRKTGVAPASVLTLSAPAEFGQFLRAAGVPSPLTARRRYDRNAAADLARAEAAGREWAFEVDPG